eukprot:gb/GEZN01000117.1/.p1 GENE.gb/GEZN01000117.1/~~gb/GEZN01000117.1/.p1  ORF type:complete len:2179 (-),score=148.47 gb/GEZN01000117.1/:363-6272(-)
MTQSYRYLQSIRCNDAAIVLSYEPRPDVVEVYSQGGLLAKVDKRLVSISTTYSGVVANTLSLGYKNIKSSNLSVVSSMQLCGGPTGASCFRPTTYSYGSAEDVIEARAPFKGTAEFDSERWTTTSNQLMLVDINRDGSADIVAIASPSGSKEYGPVWQSMPGTTTWQVAQTLCIQQGRDLCPAKKICPGGAGGTPVGGFKPGDVWTPYKEEPFTNKWIQVGATYKCLTHEELSPGSGLPWWGPSNASQTFRTFLACCPREGVDVSLNRGDGTFGPMQRWSFEVPWQSITPMFLTDLDGDDALDLFTVHSSGVFCSRNIPSPTSVDEFTLDKWKNVSPDFLTWDSTKHLMIIEDVNQDARPDLVGFGNTGVMVALGTSNQSFLNATMWSTSFGYNPPAGYRIGTNPRFLRDMNGDGRLDIVAFSTVGVLVAINSGQRFEEEAAWSKEYGSWSSSWSLGNFPVVQDMNGDFLPDVVGLTSQPPQLVVSLNTGVDLKPQQIGMLVPAEFKPESTYVFYDYNGDSWMDLLVIIDTGVRVALNNGAGGWILSEKYVQRWNPTANIFTFIQDVTGDMLPDIVRNGPGGFMIGANPNDFPLLTKVTDSFKNVKEISYSWTTNRSFYTTTPAGQAEFVFPHIANTAPSQIVVSTRESDGVGGLSEVLYRYTDRGIDKLGRAFSGFKQESNMVVPKNQTVIISFLNDYPLNGMQAREERWVNGVLVEREEISYTVRSSQGGDNAVLYQVFTNKQLTSSFELDGEFIMNSTTEFTSVDAYGNVLAMTVRQTSANADLERVCQTNYTYTNEPDRWNIGRLDRRSQACWLPAAANSDASKIRVDVFTYYPVNRRVRVEHMNAHSLLSLKHTMVYDAKGQIVESIRSPGSESSSTRIRKEIRAYDLSGQLISRTSPLNHTDFYAYDQLKNLILQRDPNGLETRKTYDSFQREKEIIMPDGTEKTFTFHSDNLEAFGVFAAYSVALTQSGSPNEIVVYDSKNREIQHITDSFYPGRRTVKITMYDNLGRLERVSNEFYDDEPENRIDTVTFHDLNDRVVSEQVEQNGVVLVTGTQVTYHALKENRVHPNGGKSTLVRDLQGNPTVVNNSLGEVSVYVNDGWDNLVGIVDPMNNTVTQSFDDVGNQIRRDDPNRGRWKSEHDEYGNVVYQVDANGNTIHKEYDEENRVVRQEQPEGLITHQYDSAVNGFGKVAKIEGYDGYQRSFEYDTKGRPSAGVSRPPGGRPVRIEWYYDHSSRLAEQRHPGGHTIFFCHTSKGFLESVRSECCSSSAEESVYWRALDVHPNGRSKKERYGNGLTNEFILDELSRFSRIGTFARDGTPLRDWTYTHDSSYNMQSRYSDVAQTNEIFSFDLLDRLCSSIFESRAPGLQYKFRESWYYNSIGGVTGTSTFGVNLEHEYHHLKPHAVLRAGSHTYSHDANGNYIRRDDTNITWTSFNKFSSLVSPNQTIRVKYGPSQERFLREVNGKRTWYYSKSFEMQELPVESKLIFKFNIYVEDRLVAIHSVPVDAATASPSASPTPLLEAPPAYNMTTVRPATTALPRTTLLPQIFTVIPSGASTDYGHDWKNLPDGSSIVYLHHDHIGSVDTVTDGLGNVIECLRANPFGVYRPCDLSALRSMVLVPVLNTSWTSNQSWNMPGRGWSGHLQIPNVGLVDMGGRVYDPLIPGFLSPDPFIQDQYNPLMGNPYSPMLFNPLKYDDPTGHRIRGLRKFVDRTIRAITKPRVMIAIALTVATVSLLAPVLLAGVISAGLSGLAATVTASALTGAVSGFVGGAVATDSMKGGLKGAIQGALTSGVGSFGGPAPSIYRAVTNTVTKGIASELAGEKFADGLVMGGVTSASSYFYSSYVKYDAQWSPGGAAHTKSLLSPPIHGANNIGFQGGSVNTKSWSLLDGLHEGGRYSRALNQIPGINAVAGLHDTFQIGLGDGLARNSMALNVLGMFPATAITLGALLDNPSNVAFSDRNK